MRKVRNPKGPPGANVEAGFIIEKSVLISLSAVSEAPTSKDLPFRCAVYGRFRYSDLNPEAAPRICFPESTGDPTNQSPQLSPMLRRTKVIRLTSVACLTTMSEVIIKMKVSRAYSSGIDHGCAPSRDRRRARFQVSPNCGT